MPQSFRLISAGVDTCGSGELSDTVSGTRQGQAVLFVHSSPQVLRVHFRVKPVRGWRSERIGKGLIVPRIAFA